MTRQPHLAPPPITFGPEAFYGEVILQEFEGELAVALWKSLRAVSLWTEADAAELGPVFNAGARKGRIDFLKQAGAPPEIAACLTRAAGILEVDSPEVTQVALDLSQISDWASERGALRTALEYKQAAAAVAPGDAALSNAVGRLARLTRDYSRAESWYRQAIFTAKQQRNWEVFAAAWIGLGSIHVIRGNYPAAERAHVRALRAARRHSVKTLIAAAHHELTIVAIHTRKVRRVVAHARAALEAYGPGHARIAALAHDVAAYWMVRGYYSEALTIFRSLPDFTDALDRLSLAATMARAAGGAGDEAEFQRNWRNVARQARDHRVAQRTASAWLDLSYGAAMLGRRQEALTAAAEARSIAQQAGESAVFLKAGELEEALRKQGIPDEAAAATRAPAPVMTLSSKLLRVISAGAPA